MALCSWSIESLHPNNILTSKEQNLDLCNLKPILCILN